MAHAGRTTIVVAALLIATWVPTTLRTPAVAAQDALSDVIQIPVRWCALQGTTAATSPATLDAPDTDAALMRRLERATDRVWLPGAHIVFRSAMTTAVAAPASFPIIADPNPPPAGKGVLGDILAPDTGDATERNKAIDACTKTWDKLARDAGVTLSGPIAINVQHFLGSNGQPSANPGQSRPVTVYDSAGKVVRCPKPSDVSKLSNGALAVADPSTITVDDTALIAHELGHLLNLRHGNGLDDNGNGPYDGWCDFAELSTTPATFMDATVSHATDLVTDRQREESRAVATAIDGAILPSTAATHYPTCATTPDTAVAGDTVSVKASDFGRPSADVQLDLGGEPIGNGTLDSSDVVDIDVVVPTGTRTGLRLVTVAVVKSGLSAVCFLDIRSGP